MLSWALILAGHLPGVTVDSLPGRMTSLDVLTSPERKRREVIDAARTLEEITGRRPQFFRFPGGCHAPADVALVREAGELPVGWDVVSGDPFQRDPAVIVRNVLDNVRPGSIVVLHLNGAPNAPATAAALREIIPGLHARGLTPVTLEQLLTPGAGENQSTPGTEGPRRSSASTMR